MKMLFKKFMASSALDRGDKSGKHPEAGDMRRFNESLHAMDSELRATRTRGEIPAGLHASIMRSVHASSAEARERQAAFTGRHLAMASFALVAGIGVLWILNRPASTPPEGAFASDPHPSFAVAFGQGHDLTQAAPQAVVQPLSGELSLLDRDFQNALAFVTASLP